MVARHRIDWAQWHTRQDLLQKYSSSVKNGSLFPFSSIIFLIFCALIISFILSIIIAGKACFPAAFVYYVLIDNPIRAIVHFLQF